MATTRSNKLQNVLYRIGVGVAIALIAALTAYTFCRHLSHREVPVVVYIDDDDTVDSVFCKIEQATDNRRIHGFRILSRYARYADNICTGAYTIAPTERIWRVFLRFKRGQQNPIRLVVPASRTIEKFSAAVAEQLMLDSATIVAHLTDSAVAAHYGYTRETITSMIIPNTYEVYWNIDIYALLDRWQREYTTFWNVARQRKAQDLRLSQTEVSTLASIVDGETANKEEKPIIAGLYYNRLLLDMPLQADPTILFANNAYGQQRVHGNDLTIDSPYNTYKYKGLPPGPIRIATIDGIDAVLNMQRHKYLYMCAKEDFSGRHNFADTYIEHKENAKRYRKALDERGIQ